ncbi:glutaminase domain-containing protein [Dysgonomonas sp. 25]|uniref:glutaminase domain-containing protein n=1 Tax=Dysgonomonas sp. 25 TaxID=2302933 RepID=UPI0013D5D86B|nr:DUF4965 domain-containing protein [Dysgonomonas sp. 25]NDV70158.1 DUF4965 domain-containing protein [Dysgonomonas sp. 25]
MRKILCTFLACCALPFMSCDDAQLLEYDVIKNDLRAPAYPLITIDPYTSGWSMTDKLYDENVKHWTGKEFPLIGVLKVDGETYRFMGVEKMPLDPIAAISTEKKWLGKYTFTKPQNGWEKTAFNDNAWKEGEAAFGTPDELNVKTLWQTKDVWVRRDIQITQNLAGKKLFLEYSHDDTFELYINGIQLVKTGYEWRKNVLVPIPDEIAKTIVQGEKTVIAAHCNNRTGGALVDFGLYVESDTKCYLGQTAQQTSVDVQATQTHYTFDCGNVELKVSFMAPLLMDDLELVSRPVNYISYAVSSKDGQEHDVDLYLEGSPNWALNFPIQDNKAEAYQKDGLVYLKTGSTTQDILGKRGDDIRIDWGYFYLASETANTTYSVGNPFELRQAFVQNSVLTNDGAEKERASLALVHDLGKTKSANGKFMLGYDDIYSIQYFGDNLRPYWNKDGSKTIENAFAQAAKDYVSLREKCYVFDKELMESARKVGGQKYAELCALAYRQSISAHKLVEAPNGDLLFLSKENFSNGSIGTVDVTYPSAPLFLYYNPELAKGLLNHIFYYSESGKWKKPFPSHDVGTYPLANGQTYGDDMPVEEAGNMLTLAAAVTAIEGNATYAEKHWDVMTIWADYLSENGLDPDNQLCTDDFAGHFAHNVNLSVKAIMGVASYGYMAEKMGKQDIADKYKNKAKEMAAEWMKMADDGDHYRLTFDKAGTWSQKYNLIWDKLLNWNIFPAEVREKEIAYYLTKQNEYGLPLDNRSTYTKSDWIMWTATLASDQATFETFINPVHKFMNETEDRIPMSDWYYTDSKKHVGFQARSVVGGYYIKMLEEKLK